MPLYEHQKQLLALNPSKYLMAWGTGSGKTLAAIELCKQKGGTTLIICPKSIKEQWREQVDDSWLVMSKEEFKKEFKKRMWWPSIQNIIIDEAHYFSNYKSQLSKCLLTFVLTHNPANIYLLTATPYLSTSWNIYTYGKIFGKNWSWPAWNNRYFYKVRMGNHMVPMPRKEIDGVPLEKEISRLVNVLGNTVALEDCFDVPDQIFEQELFDLTKEQKRAIDELEDFLPIVRYTKVAQICGGSLKGDEYVEDKFYSSEKFERVYDLIHEHKKIIVVCHFNNEIDHIKNKITDKTVYVIRGDVKNRHEIVKQAEADDDCVVLIQAACSEGYELPGFPIMVFYSYDWSLKNYIQIMGRIQRAGHIKKNVYLSLITKNTIDYDIYDTVVNKKMDFQVEIYEKT